MTRPRQTPKVCITLVRPPTLPTNMFLHLLPYTCLDSHPRPSLISRNNQVKLLRIWIQKKFVTSMRESQRRPPLSIELRHALDVSNERSPLESDRGRWSSPVLSSSLRVPTYLELRTRPIAKVPLRRPIILIHTVRTDTALMLEWPKHWRRRAGQARK